jgi:hypothetical protein
LGGKFEVEDGKGRERDEVLEKLNIDTFLIIPPKQQVNFDVLPGPAGHFCRPGYICLFGGNKDGNSSDSLKILGKIKKFRAK